jgi:hypothetical protein
MTGPAYLSSRVRSWKVCTGRNLPAVRADALRAYSIGIAEYRAGRGPRPEYPIAAFAWVATVQDEAGRGYAAGGSSKRIAVQRAAAALLDDEGRP